MSTTFNGTAACTCANFRGSVLGPDHEAERVADLIVQGFGQMDASRIVWAPELLAVAPSPVAPWDIAGWVRAQLVARLPWLRLEAGAAHPGAVWAFCILAAVCVLVAGGRL